MTEFDLAFFSAKLLLENTSLEKSAERTWNLGDGAGSAADDGGRFHLWSRQCRPGSTEKWKDRQAYDFSSAENPRPHSFEVNPCWSLKGDQK